MKNIKSLIIFGRGQFPTSSAGLRMRNWSKGLCLNGIKSKILITYPPPDINDIDLLQANEHFTLSPTSKKLTKFEQIVNKVIGVYKGYRFLLKHKNEIDAVLLYGIGFLEGIFVYRFCKVHKKIFLAERCDENRQKNLNRNLSVIEIFAMINDTLFDKYLLRRLETLFVVSSYLKKKYSKYIPENKIINSSPTFIDLEEFDRLSNNKLHPDFEYLNSDNLYVLYAGSCNLVNGLNFFLECASRLIKEDKLKFEIILIFHSGDIKRIEEYVNVLGIGNVVRIHHKITYHFLPAIYKKADILVIPEMGDVIAEAGFPGKVGEYLASGKSIISTSFSDLNIYLKNEYNAMISPVKDYKTYTSNLKKLIINKELRLFLGKNARKTAEEFFDIKKAFGRMINEYNR